MDVRFGEVRFQAYGLPKFGGAVIFLIRKLTDHPHPIVREHVLGIDLQDFLELCEGFVIMLELRQG